MRQVYSLPHPLPLINTPTRWFSGSVRPVLVAVHGSLGLPGFRLFRGFTLLSPFSHSPFIVQELCESRGGRPGLSVLTSLLVSVDVKLC